MTQGVYERKFPPYNKGLTKFTSKSILAGAKNNSIIKQKRTKKYESYVELYGQEKAQKMMIDLHNLYYGKGSLDKKVGKEKSELMSKNLSLLKKNTLIDELYELKPHNDSQNVKEEIWLIKKYLTLMRDEFKCQICGKKHSLVVHHIIHRELLEDPHYANNLITLCISCHTRLENILNIMFYGQSRRKIDNLEEYLKNKYKVPIEKAQWIKNLLIDSIENILIELKIPLETTRDSLEKQGDDIVRTPTINKIGEIDRNIQSV